MNTECHLNEKESLRIHDERNRVYYSDKIGLYIVRWRETGNSDIPTIHPLMSHEINGKLES